MKLTDIADKFAVYSDLCASSGVECRIVLFSRVYDILQSEFAITSSATPFAVKKSSPFP